MKTTTPQSPIHPLGTRAKILLTSVFGPYAQDDAYGSRMINPMELYQNQVTRVQGGFSLRLFHRSFGLMMIHANIESPCWLLDFPTLDGFIENIRENSYDIIGIGSIIPNIGKVVKMCKLIRQYQPNTVIVVGGHIANMAGIHNRVDADYIVKGDGIKWFREYLGQKTNAPIKHPLAYSASHGRIIGVPISDKPGSTAAVLIPSVGCPVGCNFCSTSALFGGKGNFVNFYETGDELFTEMSRLERELKVRSFFILDENFLLHRKRALRLLDLMKEHNKSWMLNVFSSARVLHSYTIEQIVGLGIGWVWIGLEGKESRYRKLKDVDAKEIVKTLQNHGIRVLGSTIIGLEDHTPENIDEVIDYAIDYETVFHQFMLYTPNPGTPLYEEHQRKGTLYTEEEFSIADAHGQYRFNYRHKHIPAGLEEQFLLNAFERDFFVNGPSLARLIRTLMNGWKQYKNHPDKRIVNRFDWEVNPLRSTYAGAVWAMKKWYRHDKRMHQKMDSLLQDIYSEFGWKTRLTTPVLGMYAFVSLLNEEKRIAKGLTYEPKTFYELNSAAKDLEKASAKKRAEAKKRYGNRLVSSSPVLTN
ncbi:MAG: radical SAM protein [Desulfobacterales bacterium]|nr:radical SAM protein [Desulfobacterales bacterium]